MEPDVWQLYGQMLRSRLFEEAVADLWEAGQISGEMHMGLGEEGIVAGVLAHVREGDALALDHRGTPPLVMRGVDLTSLLREFIGREDGLCGGYGGHMHLFSPEHLAASSGIVGASGPAAVGFALAGKMLRPGSLVVAFFGEGALNEGAMMEALNLAVAWQLPIIFVCKDNGQAIFTDSAEQTGGNLLERPRAFGLPTHSVDGNDVLAVWKAAEEASRRARDGQGPTFLHGTCAHREAHMLGDRLLDLMQHPLGSSRSRLLSVLRAVFSRTGATFGHRVSVAVGALRMGRAVQAQVSAVDPLTSARNSLTTDPNRLEAFEASIQEDVASAVRIARQTSSERQ
jgi:pyruvate dehydrogenase E1 component alpha subunit